jgi:predicted double-glycine peptidase
VLRVSNLTDLLSRRRNRLLRIAGRRKRLLAESTGRQDALRGSGQAGYQCFASTETGHSALPVDRHGLRGVKQCGGWRRLAAGCLLLGLVAAVSNAAQEAGKAGIWLDVPFVKQTTEGCGSASIVMLLQYWSAHGTAVSAGRDDADAIQKQLYSRKGRGIYASDVERYLKDSGFRVFPLRGNWGDLREHLAQGRPLIVSLEPGSARAPLHYVVVTGMDWQREAVFVNDPARGKLLRIERPEFEKEWLAAGNWMLLAVPAKPSAVPAE